MYFFYTTKEHLVIITIDYDLLDLTVSTLNLLNAYNQNYGNTWINFVDWLAFCTNPGPTWNLR